MKWSALFVNLALLSSCTYESPTTDEFDCIDFSLIPSVNNKDSRDLKEYIIRNDSTLATAVKLVPNQGYIQWKANAGTSFYNGRNGVVLRNYVDTIDWRNLDSWVNKRDLISLEYHTVVKGRQKLVDDEAAARDSNLLRVVYFRSTADGDVFDADWQLDSAFDNFIEITKMDTQFIEGNFNLYFKLNHQSTIYLYAPFVQFRCGYFKAKKY